MKLRLKKTQLESETQPVVKALGDTQEALWIHAGGSLDSAPRVSSSKS